MERLIIGRDNEKAVLQSIVEERSAALVAITGRRRIGKTYLIKSFFKEDYDFDYSGTFNGDMEFHLSTFALKLNAYKNPQLKTIPTPSTWLDAFMLLQKQLAKIKTKKKLVVFIDEMPWIDTPKSMFMMAFDWFWNTWASTQNIVVIICGSATSWMIKKILNNNGGLHNRVTSRIHLQPFTLSETKALLRHKNIVLSNYNIAELYMAFGGVPYYLNEVTKGESTTQAIQRICFAHNGLLTTEFDNLYRALFANATTHIAIVKALGSKAKGLTRQEVLQLTKLQDGGSFTDILQELEWCDFIQTCSPYGNLKKDTLYRLTDEFTLFYLKFMYKKKQINWQQFADTPIWKTWCGYAFENLCIKHLPQIKKTLGIAGVHTNVCSYTAKANSTYNGVQIDVLIERRDGIINLCEMKFSSKPYTITKNYATELRNKKGIFIERTKTQKPIFVTLVTAMGLHHNMWSSEAVQQQLVLDNLF